MKLINEINFEAAKGKFTEAVKLYIDKFKYSYAKTHAPFWKKSGVARAAIMLCELNHTENVGELLNIANKENGQGETLSHALKVCILSFFDISIGSEEFNEIAAKHIVVGGTVRGSGRRPCVTIAPKGINHPEVIHKAIDEIFKAIVINTANYTSIEPEPAARAIPHQLARIK